MEYSSTTRTPLFNSLPVGIENNNNLHLNVHKDQESLALDSLRETLTNRQNNHASISNEPQAALQLDDHVNNRDLGISSIPTNGPQNDTIQGSSSNSLSCEELLDLYSSTRTNYLEARDHFHQNGKASPEIFLELDSLQRHLNYKSDHFYYLLLNASRTNLEFLQKLRERTQKENKISPVTNPIESPISLNEADLDMRLIGSGDNVPNGFKSSKTANGVINTNAPDASRQEEVYPINSTSLAPNETSSSDASSKTSSSTTPSSIESDTSGKADFSRSPDIDLYLQKVAKLRGEKVAKAEALRLQERLQPLKRIALSSDAELKFNSIINEINEKSLGKAAAADFFKKNIPPLSGVEDSKKVSGILTKLIQNFSRELAGTEYDYRPFIINEVLSAFKEGDKVYQHISRNTRAMLRITNWLRRDLKNKDDINIKCCFELLERLKLSHSLLTSLELSRIMNYVKKKESKWVQNIDRILKQADEMEASDSYPLTSTGSQTSTGTEASTTGAPTSTVASSTTHSTTTTKTDAPSTIKPTVTPPIKPQVVKNPSFSRRPPSSDQSQEQHPRSVSPSHQFSEASSKPSNQVRRTTLIQPNDKKQKSSQPHLQQNQAVSKPDTKKKWSFNNYIQTSKRKGSASEQSLSNKENQSPAVSIQEYEHMRSSSSPFMKKSILKPRVGTVKVKKSVRFADRIETREFESEIGHARPIEQEHKRAREMESSEAQTLKKHKSDDINVGGDAKQKDLFTVRDIMDWKPLIPIDFNSIENFKPEDVSESRGGTITLKVFPDLKIPTRHSRVDIVSASPFEPPGLIIDVQHLIDGTTDLSNDAGALEEGEEEDDYDIEELEEKGSAVADDNATEKAPDTVDIDASGESSKIVPVEENTGLSSKTSGVHVVSDTNRNVDEDVLALLDDDDFLDNHNSNEDD